MHLSTHFGDMTTEKNESHSHNHKNHFFSSIKISTTIVHKQKTWIHEFGERERGREKCSVSTIIENLKQGHIKGDQNKQTKV